ncbi:MAG: hypothetical protein ACLUOS_12165 [Odoribacter splanchnicus]
MKKQPFYVKAERSLEKAAGIQRGEGRLVWFHAASLGEFEQGRR